MKHTKLILAITPLLFGVSLDANAQLSSQHNHGNTSINSVVTPSAGAVVLFDQISLTPRGNGTPDQNFEATFDSYDSEVADDFVVPGPEHWSLSQINILGSQGAGGTATSVDITIYSDNLGAPGAAVAGCSFASLPTTDTAGDFATALPAGCSLSPGTYWMGHITNQDFGVEGQHFFSNTDIVNGSEAHWINPGDGFGTGCTTFAPAGTVCGVGGGAPAYDFLYSIEGTEVAVFPPSVPIPSLSWFAIGLMFLTLGFFGRRYLR